MVVRATAQDADSAAADDLTTQQAAGSDARATSRGLSASRRRTVGPGSSQPGSGALGASAGTGPGMGRSSVRGGAGASTSAGQGHAGSGVGGHHHAKGVLSSEGLDVHGLEGVGYPGGDRPTGGAPSYDLWAEEQALAYATAPAPTVRKIGVRTSPRGSTAGGPSAAEGAGGAHSHGHGGGKGDIAEFFPALFTTATARDALDPSKPAALRPTRTTKGPAPAPATEAGQGTAPHGETRAKGPATTSRSTSGGPTMVTTSATTVPTHWSKVDKSSAGTIYVSTHTVARRASQGPDHNLPSGEVESKTRDSVNTTGGMHAHAHAHHHHHHLPRRTSSNARHTVRRVSTGIDEFADDFDTNPTMGGGGEVWGSRGPNSSPGSEPTTMGRWSAELFKVGMSAAEHGSESPVTGLTERSPMSSDGDDLGDFEVVKPRFNVGLALSAQERV